MTTPKPSPRALALSTLLAIEKGQYGNIALDTALRRTPLSEADRHLYTALVYGVTERRTTLEFLLSRFSARPLSRLDNTVRVALSMGLYQLIYLDRVPDHAALDETVSLVPPRASGFVNALLRAYLRFEAALPPSASGIPAPRENGLTTPEAWLSRFPELGEEELSALSVCYGIPMPLCRLLVEALGYSQTAAILEGFCQKPPLTLRVNTQKTTPQALEKRLTAEGLTVLPSLYAPHALRLPEGAVTATPAFQDGEFFIQDEASQLCVAALDPRPGDVVVDTCACPGSKSFGLALTMEDQGELHAFDLHQSKLSLIASGAARLGLTCITSDQRDAREPDPALLGKCDRVLCDVPCSGLGVLAKKPEIRHKELTQSFRLPAIQAAILEASSAYLKSGGLLVYSTCTLLPTENQAVIAGFLEAHPEFEPLDFSFAAQTEGMEDIHSQGGMVTLLPNRHRTDGFFIARLRRK